MILLEKKYQTFDTVFHHQMKNLEVRQKYSAARRIFNSFLGVSSGDETLHLMFDILINPWFWFKNGHFFQLVFCWQYKSRKSLLRYSRKKKRLSRLKKQELQKVEKLTFFQRG